MPDVKCSRCGQTRAGFERPPFPGAIGTRIVGEICQDCWSQWTRQQMMLINHYGLNLLETEAQKFMREQMEKFLFEDTVQTPEGWEPGWCRFASLP